MPTEQATTQNPAAGSEQPQAQASKSAPASSPEDFRSRLSRTNSSGFRVGVAIGVIVLIVAVFFVYRYVTSYESTDDAQVDGHISSISTRISGHVTKLNVEDNQYVSAGTVLVEIDPADYQVAYERAKADYDDAQAAAVAAGVNVPIITVNTTSQVSASQADVESARAGISAAKQQFEAAKAQLAQAQANDVKAQNDLARYKQLVDKQEISQQQYDQAIASAKASTATVEAARSTADASQQQVTQAQGKLVQAQANLSYANTAGSNAARKKEVSMGGSIVEENWGEAITKFESTQLPLVFHFRPTKIVKVKKEKLKEFASLVRKNLGIKFDDDDGPYGPQATISGSGDGWDDCD